MTEGYFKVPFAENENTHKKIRICDAIRTVIVSWLTVGMKTSTAKFIRMDRIVDLLPTPLNKSVAYFDDILVLILFKKTD